MRSKNRRLTQCIYAGAISLLLVVCSAVAVNAASYEWSKGLYPAMVFNGPVYATAVFDDGTGPALYAAGKLPGRPAARGCRT